MAKKQSDGEASAEAARRRPQKKTAAPKSGAKGHQDGKPTKSGKPSKPARPSKPVKPEKSEKSDRQSRDRDKAARTGRTGRLPKLVEAPAQAELPIAATAARAAAVVDELLDEVIEIPPSGLAHDLPDLDVSDAEIELGDVDDDDDDDDDDIEDAEILAESHIDTSDEAPTGETPAVDPAIALAGEDDEDDEADDDEDDDGAVVAEVVEVDDAPPTLSPEEQELTALYGGDLARPAIAHAEYADRQTADEDRPMVPEINARDERKLQWQERRDRRRRRRDERDRLRQERRDQPRPAHDTRPDRPEFARGESRPPYPGARPQSPMPPAPSPSPSASSPAIQLPPTNGAEHDSLARVGTPLGDAAATVFAQLRNGQPLPVRQLAAMMRKRSLVETDPEQLWPQLKAELLGDERSYRTLGLRPRIVYRGRDLFAPGPVSTSQTAEAEASVAAALSRLAGATHRALAARIARANGPGFERLIHAFLVAAGYRDIAWIKRVGGISYAQAIAPGIDRPVLISARSGDQPIDRRGIGELRVGVEAKDLVAGILFSARELSEEAERELERAGRSISVICGDQLVAALIAAGVGVVSSAAPIHYVDDQLLDELLAG